MSLTWNLGPAEEIKHISVTVLFCMLLFFFEGCYTNIEFVLWVYPPMVSTLVGKMFFSPWNFWVPYFQLHPQGLRYRITYKMSSFINVDYYIYMFYIYMCYHVIVADVWSQCYSYWTEVVRCHYRGWWFRSKKVLVSSTLWSSPMPHVFAFGIWWNKKHHGWWQVRVSIRWGSRVKANVNDGCIRAVVPPMWPPIWRGLFSVYILGGSSTNPKWIISYIYIIPGSKWDKYR